MDDHDQRQECGREFEQLRLSVATLEADTVAQGKAIARVEANIVNLTRSLDRLTAAMWGIVVSIAAFGLMFIVETLRSKGGF